MFLCTNFRQASSRRCRSRRVFGGRFCGLRLGRPCCWPRPRSLSARLHPFARPLPRSPLRAGRPLARAHTRTRSSSLPLPSRHRESGGREWLRPLCGSRGWRAWGSSHVLPCRRGDGTPGRAGGFGGPRSPGTCGPEADARPTWWPSGWPPGCGRLTPRVPATPPGLRPPAVCLSREASFIIHNNPLGGQGELINSHLSDNG